MVEKLEIEGFKCFDRVEVRLSNLTLLTGTNSSGKSSVIQALLLLANNALEVSSSPLNGTWLRMGRFDECRNHIINARKFSLKVSGLDENYSLLIKAREEDDLAEVVIKEHSNYLEKLLSSKEKHLLYIPANRLGPVDLYEKNFDNQNILGKRGEYVVDYLYRNQKSAVMDSLIKEVHSVTLMAQVNHWLESLFSVSINIIENKGSNTYSVEYKRRNGKALRPYHVGSGISYALSVLISCLAAKEGDVVILENPEIHLHPKAQSDLTEFLCFIAKGGVQIIVETHSDHVFNGVRKSVARGTISPEQNAIQFFIMNEDGISMNKKIELNKGGRVLDHHSGLFDQFDEDLDAILGL